LRLGSHLEFSGALLCDFATLRETAFVAVEGSGHNIPGERPDIVIAAIQELIRKLHP